MEPGRVGIALLIFPVYEEEALSSQCAFLWVPKQRGSTKNNPSKRTLFGWENQKILSRCPCTLHHLLWLMGGECGLVF